MVNIKLSNKFKAVKSILILSLYIVGIYCVLYQFVDRAGIRQVFLLYFLTFIGIVYLTFRYVVGLKLQILMYSPRTIAAIVYLVFFAVIRGYVFFLPVTAIYSRDDDPETTSTRLVTFNTHSNDCQSTVGTITYLNGSTKIEDRLACNTLTLQKIRTLEKLEGWTELEDLRGFSFKTQYFIFPETAIFYNYDRFLLRNMEMLVALRYFSFFLLEHFIYASILSILILYLESKK